MQTGPAAGALPRAQPALPHRALRALRAPAPGRDDRQPARRVERLPAHLPRRGGLPGGAPGRRAPPHPQPPASRATPKGPRPRRASTCRTPSSTSPPDWSNLRDHDPDEPGRLLPAARLAHRPRGAASPAPAAGAGERAVARATPPTCRRRRTTRCWSRSATRSARGWTSSPTARCAARATPTASPPRWRASTSTTRAAPWTARATRRRSRASSRRSAAASRCRSTTCASCAPTPTAW